MAHVAGIVLFALGIGLTIALHEAGHMYTARAFGMRVRRFSIGFGPKVAAFKRGDTEYSLAALPVGGFCDIAGMTAQDELSAEEAPHAMYAKPAWQRIVVLSGGVAVNVMLGFAILVGVGLNAGLPDPHADVRARVGETMCTADVLADGSLAPCQGAGPAAVAGVRPGDIITAVNGEPVADFVELRERILTMPGQTVTLGIERQGSQLELPVLVDAVERPSSPGGPAVDVGSIGVASAPVDVMVQHDWSTVVPATAAFSWDMAKSTVEAIIKLPAKVPGVVAAVFGSERADDSPMSVVGASRVGGELVERSLWPAFFMMLASLNYFLALFNLIPLPPFDGGHIAVVIYEKIRDAIRRLRGRPALGPADYRGLMPVTYVMAALLMGFGALVILADVVNPIRLFG
ncbi:site-2 protease family protein [Corynebacterium lizhenjunii]|uniref:Zinc metalloprotease Rip1 n=1 Tax=Corynebacterium lizhenjunii TaxID=2709394 RepID=A0A7T0KCT9_9CORY|nr:M50 family metallopeptidase [Corynebacterium lizhenjunii]QPK78413.1 site-2 protease family protein [Corynebacterium lizhenjunii]